LAETAVVTWNIGAPTDPTAAGNVKAAIAGLAARASVIALQEALDPRVLVPQDWAFVAHSERGLTSLYDTTLWKFVQSVELKRALVVELQHLTTGLSVRFTNVHVVAIGQTRDQGREANAKLHIVRKLDDLRASAPSVSEVVLGDFNFNPHDGLLVSADGFAANAYWPWVQRKRRKGDAALYNPTWRLHGGRCGAQGSYYRSADESGLGPWHIFDQILVSPELVDESGVDPEVVCSVGTIALARRTGTPNRQIASDHLPVRLLLDLASAAIRKLTRPEEDEDDAGPSGGTTPSAAGAT